MQIETVRPSGLGDWVLVLVGRRSERFRRVTLTSDYIANLAVANCALPHDGDWRLPGITLRAYSPVIAFEFDPYFGLSVSRVGPLSHHLEAAYEHLLELPSALFLLADHAGAGKTIMAGLLVRKLYPWGRIEWVLVVCPEHVMACGQRNSPGAISFRSNLYDALKEIAQPRSLDGLGGLCHVDEK